MIVKNLHLKKTLTYLINLSGKNIYAKIRTDKFILVKILFLLKIIKLSKNIKNTKYLDKIFPNIFTIY